MTDPNLAMLQAELARVDLLIRCYVRRRQLLHEAAAPAGLGSTWPDGELDALLQAPLGSAWTLNGTSLEELTPEVLAELPPALAEPDPYVDALGQEYAQVLQRAAATTRQAHEAGHPLRLHDLQQAFGLDQFESNVFLLVLAATLDPRYARLYAQLLDDLTLHHPTVGLILDVLCLPGLSRLARLAHFEEGAPLIRNQLLEMGGEAGPLPVPLIAHSLTVPAPIVAWLFGRYRPQPLLAAAVQLEQSTGAEDATDVHLTAEVWPELADILQRSSSLRSSPVLCLVGDEHAAQAAARRVATTLRRPLLTTDMCSLLKQGMAPSMALRLTLRDARLVGAVAHLRAVDTLLQDGILPADLWAELRSFPHSLVTSGQIRWRAEVSLEDRVVVSVEVGKPSFAQRQRLWRHFLGADMVQADEVTRLAAQFELAGGEILGIVAAARALVACRNDGALQVDDVLAALRLHTSARLADLAYKITPRYGWQDLVLPDEQTMILREVVAMVRGRHKVLEEWGLGKKLVARAAVTVLFSGEPGTGKTMAAEVLARDLGLDLYKIDLASMVSKYIGETEKNLERIFAEAERSSAILFFDEADALFGKRSGVRDSHDRYANIGVSYLLQRMETYDGITVLATNLRSNLDEAFTRRLQYLVDFPFPEPPERLRIWMALLPIELPLATDVDLEVLAQRYKLSGGNIRNAIVTAAYLAAAQGDQVTIDHLWHGIRRELQKMARLVQDVESPNRSSDGPGQSHAGRPGADESASAKFFRARHR